MKYWVLDLFVSTAVKPGQGLPEIKNKWVIHAPDTGAQDWVGLNHMTCQLAVQHPTVVLGELPMHLYWVNEIKMISNRLFLCSSQSNQERGFPAAMNEKVKLLQIQACPRAACKPLTHRSLQIEPNWGLEEAVNERNSETAPNTRTPKPGLGVTKALFNNFFVREIFKFANVHVHVWSHPSHYPVHPPTPPWLPHVTHRSWSWSWMTDLHPFHSMSISLPIPQIRLFQTWPLKLQGQGHGCGQRARP